MSQQTNSGGLRVETRVRLRTGHHGAKGLREVTEEEPQPHQKPGIPRIVRLLALAHRWQMMIDEGEMRDQAEIARRAGLTRARVTQIMDLRWLSPALKEEILHGVVDESLCEERDWRATSAAVEWSRQIAGVGLAGYSQTNSMSH